MSEIGIVLIVALAALWVVLGLGAALTVGALVRRAEEERRLLGSRRAASRR